MPKYKRDLESPSRHLYEIPGPHDYQTLPARDGNTRPLSSHKTFGLGNTFGQDPRTLNRTRQYSKEWAKDGKNKLGPGPAAYSSIYDAAAAKKLRG